MTTLFQRLGGHEAVEAVVETFYRMVLKHPHISDFFEQIEMEDQILKQKAFLTMAFGGPIAYTGKDLSLGHRHLVAQGLNDSHVDVVIQLLEQALTEHGVATQDIKEVAAIAESVRAHVLNRA